MHEDGRLVAVSSYFNDAVVSCGCLLAARPGSAVLTVFTGMPLGAAQLSDRDRRSGFKDAREALLARHAQSDRALSLLGVQGAQMDLLDERHLESGEGGRLTGALAAALSALRPRIILIPLGLFSPGHIRVCDAGMTIRALFPRVVWIAYEEAVDGAPPGAVQERLAFLLRQRITASPFGLAQDAHADGARRRAMAAWASLEDQDCAGSAAAPARHPERYWRLSWKQDKVA
ncbi:PIG-L family deacetylase [Achromobacter spanius]|uniref:PIG-L family deacetylase n=1 Tax=Achromobacter spanius TaxID=217203 RepID=UPI00320A653C